MKSRNNTINGINLNDFRPPYIGYEIAYKDPAWVNRKAEELSKTIIFNDENGESLPKRETTPEEAKTLEAIITSALYTAEYHHYKLDNNERQVILDMAEYCVLNTYENVNGYQSVYLPLTRTFSELHIEAAEERKKEAEYLLSCISTSSDYNKELDKLFDKGYNEVYAEDFQEFAKKAVDINLARVFVSDFSNIPEKALKEDPKYGDDFVLRQTGAAFESLATPLPAQTSFDTKVFEYLAGKKTEKIVHQVSHEVERLFGDNAPDKDTPDLTGLHQEQKL